MYKTSSIPSIRMTPAERKQVEQAALLAQKTITSFSRQAILESAQKIIDKTDDAKVVTLPKLGQVKEAA